MKTFRNPLSMENGADPFMTYDPVTGYYYAMVTTYDAVRIFRSRHAATIRSDEDSLVVYTPEFENGTFCHFWAPEMHKAPNGKWYIYTSSMYRREDYENKTWGEKRLFILESETEDPFDGFHFKSRPDDDTYAIDPTVYTAKDGKQYICYSLCGDGQKLEIRELINPYTFGDKRAVISAPIYDWEMVGPYNRRINEGAFFVENEGKLFILYSYNGCYSDDYGLAVLEYLGGEMCDAASWKKYDHPTFTKGNGVYGPGHATFFRSPDRTEVWVCYHCLETSSPTEEQRMRRMNIQKIEFDEDGRLKEQIAIGWDTDMLPPSGEIDDE